MPPNTGSIKQSNTLMAPPWNNEQHIGYIGHLMNIVLPTSEGMVILLSQDSTSAAARYQQLRKTYV